MPAPFDCDEEFEHWENKWTPEKMAWCCHEVGRGCAATTTTLHCDGDTQSQEHWTPAKRRWCCINRGRGCTTTTSEPFDCEAGKDNYQAGWSDQKKSYCCHNYGFACRPMLRAVQFDCKSGEAHWMDDWSPKKKKWCCDYKSVHCYECDESSMSLWSEKQHAWCCRHEDVCESTTSQDATDFITNIHDMIMR